MIIETPQFKIYFGSAVDNLHPSYYLNLPPQTNLLHERPFAFLQNKLHLNNLTFFRQIHSIEGLIIETYPVDPLDPFAREGDYLITNIPGYGVGVMAADCLPLVFADSKNKVVAAVHAGWRGSVGEIARITLEKMRDNFGSKVEDIAIFLGPSAQRCCYQVSKDFAQNLAPFSYGSQCLIVKSDQLYFDLPLFNSLQLQQAGVKASAISREYNFCTICDHRFFSYRRQGEASGRQMSVVVLK